MHIWANPESLARTRDCKILGGTGGGKEGIVLVPVPVRRDNASHVVREEGRAGDAADLECAQRGEYEVEGAGEQDPGGVAHAGQVQVRERGEARFGLWRVRVGEREGCA